MGKRFGWAGLGWACLGRAGRGRAGSGRAGSGRAGEIWMFRPRTAGVWGEQSTQCSADPGTRRPLEGSPRCAQAAGAAQLTWGRGAKERRPSLAIRGRAERSKASRFVVSSSPPIRCALPWLSVPAPTHPPTAGSQHVPLRRARRPAGAVPRVLQEGGSGAGVRGRAVVGGGGWGRVGEGFESRRNAREAER